MAQESLVISINEKGALQVQRKIAAIGQESAKTAKQANLLKQSLQIVGFVGVAAGARSAIGLLAEFGQTMATVKAVSGATEEEFKKLEGTARTLGETTRFTAVQSAQSLLQLTKAGLSTNEALQAVGSTLNLAQAAGADLGRSAEITVNVLRAFRGDASELAKVMDVLVKAANTSTTDVSGLGDAMKFVAPIARGMGISLEETAAGAAILTNAGLDASLAGTGLKAIMAALEAPLANDAKILKSMGISADEVKITSVGLTGALERLRKAGLDTGLALKLFGLRGGPAAEVLVSAIPDLERFTAMMQDAGGIAKETAAIMDDTLNGALLRLRAAFQSVILSIGKMGADEGLTKWANGLAEAFRWLSHNLDLVAKALTVAGAALLVAFGPAIIAKVSAGLLVMMHRLGAFTALLVAHPLLAFATALTAVITALVVFGDKINVLGEDFITLGDIGTAALEQLRDNFTIFRNSAVDDVDEVQKQSKTSLNNVALFGLAMIQTILQVVDEVIGLSFGLLGGIGFAIKSGIDDIRQGALPNLKKMGESFNAAFMEGLTQSVLGDFFVDVLKAAEVKALERNKKIIEDMRKRPDQGFIGPIFEEQRGQLPPPPEEKKLQFADIIKGLEREGELLRLNNGLREVRAATFDAEDALERKLNTTEAEQLAGLVVRNRGLATQAALLDEIKGPQMIYTQQVAALNVLLANEAITQDEFNKKLKELNEALYGVTDDALVSFSEAWTMTWQNATNELIDFVGSGRQSWESLVDGILQQIQRLAAQQAILLTLKALGLDISGSGLGGSGTPAKALGGSFMVGGTGGIDSQPVNFMATPGEKVTVTPPGRAAQEGASAAPIIRIYNVTDPSEIPDAMGGPAGSQVILNVIRRNKNNVKQVLS